jgi:hypothetical protein
MLYRLHPGASIAAALIFLGSSTAVVADKAADSADKETAVVALETQCEAEREERIKPLRAMEIAKCNANPDNEPGYCERYWKDYGNAVRTSNGTMTPRMFDDLPVCVAAFKARKALADGDDLN